jgi:hypothetical protein
VYLIQTHFRRVFGKQETSFESNPNPFSKGIWEARDFIESDPNPFSKGIWESSTSFEVESTKPFILLLLVGAALQSKVTTNK